MKQVYTLIFAIVTFNFTSAQVDSNVIDINNIKTMVNADGRLFWDGQEAFYRFPKDSTTNTIFAGNIWMGGIDNSGNPTVAATTYNSSGNDFTSGFIGSPIGELNKIWKITKEEIKTLRRDFDTDNSIDAIIPLDILTYPAFGNPNITGISSNNPIDITVDYLPYEDKNQDGIYNVFDGDLPIINGDMQLTWLLNDDVTHTMTTGNSLGFDIVGTMYANKCSNDGLIDNTIFLKYQITSQSEIPLDSFHFGIWMDGDLGCFWDDYIGCSIPTNSYYTYNRTDIDGQGGCNNVPSFGEHIPIQSTTYLNQNLDFFTYYLNSEPWVSNPQNDNEYYNYLTGSWRGGNPFTYGFDGYGGTIPYPYVFFENPADSGSISMAQYGISSADMRTIGTTALQQIQPGDKQTIEIALITHANVPHPKPDIIPIENRITQMQDLYDNDFMNWDVYLGTNQTLQVGQSVIITATTHNSNPTYSYLWSTGETTKSINVNTPNTYSVTVTNNETGCTKTDQIKVQFSEEELEQLTDFEKIIVYPNPANDVININFIALELPVLNISIYDMTGKLIKSIVIENMDIQEIDVSDLNSGLYIFDFKNEVGETLGHWKMMILD